MCNEFIEFCIKKSYSINIDFWAVVSDCKTTTRSIDGGNTNNLAYKYVDDKNKKGIGKRL